MHITTNSIKWPKIHPKKSQINQIYNNNPTHNNQTLATHITNQSIQTTQSNKSSKFQHSTTQTNISLITISFITKLNYLRVLAKQRDLVLGLVLHLCAVLTEGLKLVDELVDHIPQPLIGQLHVDDAVEDDLEEAAVVVVGVDPLLEGGRHAGVEVAEPHLAVEEAEDVVVVDVGGDGVDGGPWALLEHPIAQLLEASLVHLVDLVHVLLADVAVEVDDERLHRVRHEVRVVAHVARPVVVVEGSGRLWWWWRCCWCRHWRRRWWWRDGLRELGFSEPIRRRKEIGIRVLGMSC